MPVVRGQLRHKEEIPVQKRLVSHDSSVIDLSLSLFDFTQFQRTKRAAKIHMLLIRIPSVAGLQTKKRAISRLHRLRFYRGTMIVMDQCYIDRAWFVQLTNQGVCFVTQLRDNASFEVVETNSVIAGSNVRKDRTVFFHGQAIPKRRQFFRIVEVWDEE